MIGITLIIFIRMDRSHMQSKWIGITLVNCYLKIVWVVLHDCCVCNVHGINGPAIMLHKRIIHMASHGNKNQHKADR